MRREDEAARLANRVLICDTNAFATVLWHRRYIGSHSAAVEKSPATASATSTCSRAMRSPSCRTDCVTASTSGRRCIAGLKNLLHRGAVE